MNYLNFYGDAFELSIKGLLPSSFKRLQNSGCMRATRVRYHSRRLVGSLRPEPSDHHRDMREGSLLPVNCIYALNIAFALVRALSFWQYQVHQEQ